MSTSIETSDEKKIKSGKCIIVCAGDFTPLEIHKNEGDFVIAADNGYANCEMVGLLPDLIIGDFDSVSEQKKEEIMSMKKMDENRVVVLPKEKNDTDTLAAIRIGLEKGYRKFFFYAATGGRLDHTFANLQCLQFLKNHCAKGYIMDLHSMVTLIQNEEIKFHPGMKGDISVFCVGEKAEGVSITNMKYNVNHATITNDFPIGVSNEFSPEYKEGTISVENGSLLVMLQWKD